MSTFSDEVRTVYVVCTLLLVVCAVERKVGEHQFSHPGSVVPALQPEGAV